MNQSQQKENSVTCEQIQSWATWNAMGLIPGPSEGIEDYQKRVDYCLNLKKHIAKDLGIEENNFANNHKWLPSAWTITKPLFGIAPEWVPLYFSHTKLAPWHGGCAWIFQMGENLPVAALLQLRKSFLKQSSFGGLYKKDELIAHELAHVGRMCYEEPKFEEFFAYQTSSSWFRQTFGPIVQSSYESLLFVFVLFFTVFFELWMMINQQPFNSLLSWCVRAFPLIVVGYGCLRLAYRWKLFKRTQSNLAQIIPDQSEVNCLMYRLTDREIASFAQFQGEQIRNYFYLNQSGSFRIHVLNALYFEKDRRC